LFFGQSVLQLARRDLAAQIREAFGAGTKSAEFKHTLSRGSKTGSIRSPHRQSGKVSDDIVFNHWDPSLIVVVTRKICSEIMQTLTPFSARRHLGRNMNNEAAMLGLFNIAVWYEIWASGFWLRARVLDRS
jgi:hypothetical protein